MWLAVSKEKGTLPQKRVLDAKKTAGGAQGPRLDGKEGPGAPGVQADHRPQMTEMGMKRGQPWGTQPPLGMTPSPGDRPCDPVMGAGELQLV